MAIRSAFAQRRLLQALIFGAAALLFAVQPIISKHVLPWFGGSSAVWTTALLFFQTLLLAGYALAHLVSRCSRPRQFWILGALAGLAVLSLPILPSSEWLPSPTVPPQLQLLGLLLTNVGLPYMLLAAASPLIQDWAGRAGAGRGAYRLYAWSNAGSLVGLLSYPLLVEPFFSTTTQAWLWSGLFLLTMGGLAWQLRQRLPAPATAVSEQPASSCAIEASADSLAVTTSSDSPAATDRNAELPPGWGVRLQWLLLPLAASALLVALTNYLTQDIAAVPFLWVLPLAIYLITFIVAFSGEGAYDRQMVAWPFLFMGLLAAGLAASSQIVPLAIAVGGPLFILAIYTLVLHGELFRLRPPARYLTAFYLYLSAGGALGGLLAAVVAPLLLPLPHEFHLAIVLTTGLVLVRWWRGGDWQPWARRPALGWGLAILLSVGVTAYLAYDIRQDLERPHRIARNFYGSLQVVKQADRVLLKHGKIMHGWQMNEDPCRPTSYYGPTSGLGRAVRLLPQGRPSRLGMIGLGTGTAANLATEVTFYEINPQVLEIAESEFSFLRDCGKPPAVVLGDARLSLAAQPPQNFDLLALDAFSGDAIPIHLLTREAFAEYERHLAPGGLIAVHVSNQYLDLVPALHGIAQEFGWTAAVIDDAGNHDETTTTVWVLIFTSLDQVRLAYDRGLVIATDFEIEKTVLWTDRYSSLLPLLLF
jgi:hypothetical protein